MDSTLLPPPADDPKPKKDHYGLKPKKERKIEPLNDSGSDDKPASPLSSHLNGQDDDLLEELRRKTAALAKASAKSSPKKEAKKEEPTPTFEETTEHSPPASEPNQAVELVRNKIARLYTEEPDAKEEVQLVSKLETRRSKHQEFMYNLTTSGKSLEEIQTQWHEYYIGLPEKEKHEVWQEFYTTHSNSRKHTPRPTSDKGKKSKTTKRKATKEKHRSPNEISSQIRSKIHSGHRKRLTKTQHAKSLLFGMAMAALSLLLVTFIFFNEVYIAPFVNPGQSVSATPIIGSLDGAVDPDPKIIIPKINLEVPVVFDTGSIAEADIQNALEDGVVHYANSPQPGEKGNSVIVGHSSNNLLNSGKYKFAFVLLRRLEVDDVFFVHKNEVRYTYKIYEKKVVTPTDLSVLEPQEKQSSMTLITCDPPGTSINRLIIVAEQISPDPVKNTASTALNLEAQDVEPLPSNAPSLWSRLWPF